MLVCMIRFISFFVFLFAGFVPVHSYAQASLCRYGELQLDFTEPQRANIQGIVEVPSKGYVYSLVVKPHTTGDVLEGVLNIVDTRPNFIKPEEIIPLEIAQNVGIPPGSAFIKITVVATFKDSPKTYTGKFVSQNSVCLKPDAITAEEDAEKQ